MKCSCGGDTKLILEVTKGGKVIKRVYRCKGCGARITVHNR